MCQYINGSILLCTGCPYVRALFANLPFPLQLGPGQDTTSSAQIPGLLMGNATPWAGAIPQEDFNTSSLPLPLVPVPNATSDTLIPGQAMENTTAWIGTNSQHQATPQELNYCNSNSFGLSDGCTRSENLASPYGSSRLFPSGVDLAGGSQPDIG
jgi:hypothetical protein